jgi:hypothetical protein
MMSLPVSQQHALDAIEGMLCGGDHRLASMFAVFTALTEQESVPARETLPPGRWWPRRRSGQQVRWRRRAGQLGTRLILPILSATMLTLLVLSILSAPSTDQRKCSQATGRGAAAVQLIAPAGCPSVRSPQAAHGTG